MLETRENPVRAVCLPKYVSLSLEELTPHPVFFVTWKYGASKNFQTVKRLFILIPGYLGKESYKQWGNGFLKTIFL